MRVSRWFSLLLLLLLVASPAAADEPVTLTVFAAASLSDAFEAIATTFEAEHPGVDVVFSFGGSSTLAAQILEGAPVDVFASANREQMERLVEAGEVAGQVDIFAHNRLVLITPQDNPGAIETVADLTRDGIKLVLAAPTVPVRAYTEQMLQSAEALPEFGEGFSARVLANIVSEEDNVRRVATKIALGEADAGIVYSSDVTPDIAADVQVFSIPDSINVVADYPIAVLASSPHPGEARAFVDFMLSPESQATLGQFGLIPAVGEAPAVGRNDRLVEWLTVRLTSEMWYFMTTVLPLESLFGG